MKKFFSTLAAATIVLSAAAADVYTVDPANGSTVSSLSSLTFSSPNAGESVEIAEFMPNVTVTKDGVTQDAWAMRTEDNVIGFMPAFSEAGTYVVTIKAENRVLVTVKNGEDIFFTDDVVLTYTVDPSTTPGGGDQPFPFTITSNPATGTVTAPLESVTLFYSYDDCQGLEYEDRDVKVLYNNAEYCSVTTSIKESSADYGDYITVTFRQPAVAPGTYTLKFPEDMMAYTPDSPGYVISNGSLTFDYVIEGSSAEPSIQLTSDPEPGVVTAPLSSVVFYTDYNVYTDATCDGSKVSIKRNGADFCAATVSVKADYDKEGDAITVTFATPATDPGTYSIEFAAGAFQLESAMTGETGTNDAPVVFEYTIEGEPLPTDKYTWTMDPANGAQVNKLETIRLSYTADKIYDVTVTDASKIKLYKGTEEVSGVTYKTDGDYAIVFTLTSPVTTAGDYTLTFASGSLAWMPAGSYFPQDITDEISYNYTVIASGPELDEFGYAWTITPANGAVVDKLTNVNFSYSSVNYHDMALYDYSKVKVYKNGQEFCDVRESYDTDVEPHYMNITLRTPATEPGTYQLIIPAGQLCTWEKEGSPSVKNTEEIVLTYTVAGDADFAYTTTPASGAEVKAPFSDIVFKYFNCYEAALDGDLKSQIVVTKDNEAFTSAKFTVTNDEEALTSTLHFSTPLTEPGTYTIVLPNNMLYYFKDDTYTNLGHVPVTLTFNVLPADEPVVYDLDVVSTRPANGADIDLTSDTFNTIFIDVTKGYRPSAAAVATISNESGTWMKTSQLKFSYDGISSTRFVVMFTEPTVDGKYTLTIPQGCFGDETWQNNPEFGHANKTLEFVFNVTGGRAQIAYTIEPTAHTPGEDATPAELKDITVSFAGGVQLADRLKTATLANADNSFYVQARFAIADEESNTYSLHFDEAPSAVEIYTLTIPAGTFGDAEYMESNGMNGRTNPELTLAWTCGGVDAIFGAEGEAIYFDMQGNRVAQPAPGQIVIKVQQGGNLKIRF